jgi:hypothetical protein
MDQSQLSGFGISLALGDFIVIASPLFDGKNFAAGRGNIGKVWWSLMSSGWLRFFDLQRFLQSYEPVMPCEKSVH